MTMWIPDFFPGGMPRELRACQHPPMPVKRSRMRMVAVRLVRLAEEVEGNVVDASELLEAGKERRDVE
eukprot:16196939-Heterocapsa_arctica.AAC.1